MKRNLTQPSFFAIMQALNLLTLRVSPLDPLRAPNNLANRRAAATKPVFFVSASAGPKVSAPQRQKDPKKCVVITGTRFVFVFDNDIEGYYENLLAGESDITAINRFDASRFPSCFSGQIRGFSAEGYINDKNDRRLDDSLRYCIVVGKKALESADIAANNLTKDSESDIINGVGAETWSFGCLTQVICLS